MNTDERRKNNRVYPTKYLVSKGTLQGGFRMYGPFNTDDEARVWAVKNLMDNDWTVVPFSLTPDLCAPLNKIIAEQEHSIILLETELETEDM